MNKEIRSIAVVSGKGGSGKTMVAAALGALISNYMNVTLVDADVATGGLTYYLSLRYVKKPGFGLTECIEDISKSDLAVTTLNYKNETLRFVGVGNHRKIAQSHADLSEVVRHIIGASGDSLVIIDCRGGIDAESISICGMVDCILIVAETDTTSIQATNHLADVLSDNELSYRVGGFLINKVFDDPSTIAKTGSALFRAKFLGAIPFDIEATKCFISGNLPEDRTTFIKQVSHVAHRIIGVPPIGREWEFSDFTGMNLEDKWSTLGGFVISAIGLIISLMAITGLYFERSNMNIGREFFSTSILFLLSIMMLILAASTTNTRRIFGRIFDAYLSILRRIA